jgi:hypothetical protein
MDNKLLKVSTILCSMAMFPGALLADIDPIGDGNGIVSNSESMDDGEGSGAEKITTIQTTDGSSITMTDDTHLNGALNTGVAQDDTETRDFSKSNSAATVDVTITATETNIIKDVTITPTGDFSLGDAMKSSRVKDTLSTATPVRNSAIRNNRPQ